MGIARALGIVFVLTAVGCKDGSGSDANGDSEDTTAATAGSDSDGTDSTTTATSSDDADTGDTGDTDGDDPFAMPIGIPEPEFGIREPTPPMPDPWTSPMPNLYYVDNTHPAAVDDDTATGTPDAPRRNVPTTLPAGATVWIAGGPYPGLSIHAQGTRDAPVFVTAADPETPPVVTGGVSLSGSFLAVEHLDVAGPQSVIAIATPSDHVAVRHCEVRDAEGRGSGLYTGRWDPEDDPSIAEHIVFWDNHIHDNGDVNADFDEDHHGIAIGHHAQHVWIIDNEMARNSGDGLQINAKKAYLAETLHHVWVGRNHTHENKQTGLWTKQATDVVFSQNVVWGHRPSNSSEGVGIGIQYGPERVWVIFNAIFDCENGIGSSTSVGDEDGAAGTGQDIYAIGNVVFAIHKQDGTGPSTDPWQGGAGIRFTDETARKHVAFNTIVDTDVAFTHPRGTGGVELVDDIMVGSLGPAITIERPEAAAISSVAATLFDPGATTSWGGTDTDLAGLMALGQCTGCITGDPAFVDPPNGDFSLQPGSPAIDAATPADFATIYEGLYGESIDVDITGAPRIAGAAADLGALESE